MIKEIEVMSKDIEYVPFKYRFGGVLSYELPAPAQIIDKDAGLIVATCQHRNQLFPGYQIFKRLGSAKSGVVDPSEYGEVPINEKISFGDHIWVEYLNELSDADTITYGHIAPSQDAFRSAFWDAGFDRYLESYHYYHDDSDIDYSKIKMIDQEYTDHEYRGIKIVCNDNTGSLLIAEMIGKKYRVVDVFAHFDFLTKENAEYLINEFNKLNG